MPLETIHCVALGPSRLFVGVYMDREAQDQPSHTRSRCKLTNRFDEAMRTCDIV